MTTWQVSEVQRHLKGADYPASGKDLAKLAESNGADRELVDRLSSIGTADGPNDVMKELKGELGGPTGGAQDRSPRDDVEDPAFQVDDVQRHLKGAEYPSSGDDLARLAKSGGAPQELVDALGAIGKVDSVTTVMEKLQPHLGGPQR